VHALQVDVPAGDPAAPIPRCAGGSDCARLCTLHRSAVHRHRHSPRDPGQGCLPPACKHRWHPPGGHPEHPTADEGCRSASRGCAL